MDPTLHKLRIFREVVERQSLTLAAQELFVSQPVVSGHVRDLEEFFGAQLFYQQGRRMLLNEAGKVVFDWALEVLRATDDTKNMVRLMNSADAGSVAVGATESPGAYMLPERLADFKLRHPDARISLDVGAAVDVCEHTKQGRYDFSIVAGSEPPPPLRSEVFSYEPTLLICSPRHPLARRRTIDKEDLRDVPFVSISRRLAFDDRLGSLGVEEPNIILRLGNVEGLKQAVASGLGMAVVFKCSVDREIEAGTLTQLRVRGFSEARPFYLVHNPRKRFSPLQLQLIAFLRDWSKQDPTRVASQATQRLVAAQVVAARAQQAQNRGRLDS